VLTASSDVYALGILLYTLLTGSPPYALTGETPARARHLICEAEPDLRAASSQRARKAPAFGATLDRIILKALRKDPRERYLTAAALAADLRAWLDGRPASVTPSTLWSRVGAGRVGRAIRTAGTAILLLALPAAGGFLGWQTFLLRGERDQARARLARAEEDASPPAGRCRPAPRGCRQH